MLFYCLNFSVLMVKCFALNFKCTSVYLVNNCLHSARTAIDRMFVEVNMVSVH